MKSDGEACQVCGKGVLTVLTDQNEAVQHGSATKQAALAFKNKVDDLFIGVGTCLSRLGEAALNLFSSETDDEGIEGTKPSKRELL